MNKFRDLNINVTISNAINKDVIDGLTNWLNLNKWTALPPIKQADDTMHLILKKKMQLFFIIKTERTWPRTENTISLVWIFNFVLIKK